jgi:hypothetical protein
LTRLLYHSIQDIDRSVFPVAPRQSAAASVYRCIRPQVKTFICG